MAFEGTQAQADIIINAVDNASRVIDGVNKNTRKTLEDMGRNLTDVGMNLSMIFTVPMMLAGGTVTKFGADFDSGAMQGSLAIMNNVSDTMREQMEQTARDVSESVKFSAKEAAESYFYLASAGLDATQSIMALPKVAD